MAGRRSPIRVIGEPLRDGVTWLSDELIRVGAHDRLLSSDGFVVMAYLLSRVSADRSRRPWETSIAQISEQFGWGENRDRATAAVRSAEKDRRLVRPRMIRDGQELKNRYEFVVCAGGRRFTDLEASEAARPVVQPSKLHGKRAT